MVPSGVGENKLQEAGFMYSMEKSVWYHQGTEFGRRKAENEEKSVEKLVSYLEVGLYLSEKLKILYHFFLLQELRSGGRGAGLNNGLVLLFECAEDFGLVRGLLSSHSADIWSHVVRGVGCIDHYTRQAEIPTTFSPPYYKVCVGGDSKWLTTLTTTTPSSSSPLTPTGEQRQVKVEAETRAEMVYNILCDVSGKAPTYDTFIRWYCYPSTSMTMTSLAGNLELQRQLLPLQNHVDRQLFNARVQCVLEVFCSIIMILVASKPVISILVHFNLVCNNISFQNNPTCFLCWLYIWRTVDPDICKLEKKLSESNSISCNQRLTLNNHDCRMFPWTLTFCSPINFIFRESLHHAVSSKELKPLAAWLARRSGDLSASASTLTTSRTASERTPAMKSPPMFSYKI